MLTDHMEGACEASNESKGKDMERPEERYLPPLFHKFALDEGIYVWK